MLLHTDTSHSSLKLSEYTILTIFRNFLALHRTIRQNTMYGDLVEPKIRFSKWIMASQIRSLVNKAEKK